MADSSAIVQLRNIRDTLRHYGYANPVSVIEGVDADGNPCIRLEYDAVTWASLNRTVIVRAISKPSLFPNTAITPSVDGTPRTAAFSFGMLVQDSGAIAVGAIATHRKFVEDVLHVLRGNMQNTVTLLAFPGTSAAAEPKANAFNGAASNAENVAINVGTLIPGGRVVSPGFSS